jgi:hypothetical protein
MICCGSQRQRFFSPASSLNTAEMSPSILPGTNNVSSVFLIYQGQTALTAVGQATGRLYRFSYPGAWAAVDSRDVPGMRGITVLRKAPSR